MGWALGRVAVILTLFCSAPASAEVVVPRLISPDEAVQWTGVGSLRVSGRHACTAVLISPSEAITAAHCVVDHQSGKRVVPALYRLVLGQRTAAKPSVRGVRATAFLPGFVNNQRAIGPDTLAADVALLALDFPVSPSEATPVPLSDWPDPLAARVDIVGYKRGGSLNATIREACRTVHTAAGVTTLACDAIVGTSGSPVMVRLGVDDAPRLVASVSSRGRNGAFVVAIAPHLAELRRLLK